MQKYAGRGEQQIAAVVDVDRLRQQDAGAGERHVARLVIQAVREFDLAELEAEPGDVGLIKPPVGLGVIQAHAVPVAFARPAIQHLARQAQGVERLPGPVEAGFGEIGADRVPAVAEELVVGAADQALRRKSLDVVAGIGRGVRPGGRCRQQPAQQQLIPAGES
ncbi:MAG: hypothetical protein ABS89_09225 [Thiobacillus sp. SCN 63-1177]|nr:MAG: hypothetical protein ABS89_09225 [Thiobacillus sp. SCN 63-1177]